MKPPNCAITDLKTGVVAPEWLYYFQQIAEGVRGDGGAAISTPPSTSLPGFGTINIEGPDIGGGTIGRLAKWMQPTSLGDSIVVETGNIVSVEGTLSAFTLQGDGSGVVNLDASALASGEMPHERLPVTPPRLLGRWSPNRGPVEEIQLGTNLTLDGTGTLNAAGGKSTVVPYRFSQVTAPPPTSGQIRFDAGHPYTTATKVWIAITTMDNEDVYWGLMLTHTGSTILVQDTVDHTYYAEFRTTAEPVDHTTYVEFAVVWLGNGTSPLAANETVLVRVASPAGGGGGAGGMNLDYLGDYTAGTYFDGDIVIGPDGIAYMCVVDGTTTPPEPWPGVGIATSVGPPGPTGPTGATGPQGPAGVNAAVDATYWTVTPHAGLTNERALNSLVNGYVKSTAGEPSTVSIIPVADGGTGANNATTARANLGVGNVGTLNLSGDPNAFLNGVGTFTYPTQSVGVPSGMIAIFATACPAGWTRVAGWDGRYLRASAAYGAMGGAYSHAHGPGSLTGGSHSHGPGSYAGYSHNHGSVNISGNTSTAGDHTHYFDKSFGGSTNAGNGSTMNVDGGASGFMSRADHIHSISGTVSGDTNSGGSHSHSFSGSGTPNMDGGQGISGTSAAASVAVTGATDAQDHQPPFVDVVFCQKN